MNNILTLAKELNVNKICIDGQLKDIRQLDKNPLMIIPLKFDLQKNTIFHEPILHCYTK